MITGAIALPDCDPAWLRSLRPAVEAGGLLPGEWPADVGQPFVAIATGIAAADVARMLGGRDGGGAVGAILIDPQGPAVPLAVPASVHVPCERVAEWEAVLAGGLPGDATSVAVPREAGGPGPTCRVHGYAAPLRTPDPTVAAIDDSSHPEQLAGSVTMLVAGRAARDIEDWQRHGVWLRRATRPRDFAAAYEVRGRVFIDEQNVPADEELDWRDMLSQHVLLLVDGQPHGAGRLVPPSAAGEPVHVGRIAIDADLRGQGLGALIVTGLEQLAVHAGFTEAALSAQVQAIGFYEKMGYAVFGPVYQDAGIDHRDAKKTLTS